MKIAFCLIALGFCLMASAARAQAIPEEFLQKEYSDCMGGENDPSRAEYCDCVRKGLRSWTPEQFQAVASETKAGQSASSSPQLEALAKSCIAQILH